MSYTRFAEQMLLALYRETEGDNSQQVNFDSLAKKHGVPIDKPFWVSNLKTEWSQQGIAHFPETGTGRHDLVMIDLPGVRHAEATDPSILSATPGSIGTNDIVLHPAPSSVSTEPSNPHSAQLSDSISPLALSHDSKNWTGKQFVLVDANVISEVLTRARELQDTINSMRFESNVESDNLKGLADALVAICLMAEPEVSIIDRILASPKFKTYAALVGIIATIRGAMGI